MLKTVELLKHSFLKLLHFAPSHKSFIKGNASLPQHASTETKTENTFLVSSTQTTTDTLELDVDLLLPSRVFFS